MAVILHLRMRDLWMGNLGVTGVIPIGFWLSPKDIASGEAVTYIKVWEENHEELCEEWSTVQIESDWKQSVALSFPHLIGNHDSTPKFVSKSMKASQVPWGMKRE